jgi:RimJ/RimL family protein N-acetyltransferase
LWKAQAFFIVSKAHPTDDMIRLLPLDDPMMDRLLVDPGAFLAGVCSNSAEVAEWASAIAQHHRQFQAQRGSRPPWIGYFGRELVSARLVCVGGYKGNPDATGTVEIAYATFHTYERRGYATELARQLIQIAWKSSDVKKVIAHTLPELNASGRILGKVGMTNVGEDFDPEDGKIWRWAMARRQAG